MTVAATVTRGQALAESLMSDTCTITRAGTGAPVMNEDTGEYTDPPRTTIYTGKCRIQVRGLVAQDVEVGDQQRGIAPFELQLPVSAVGVRRNDVAHIDSSVDVDMVDREFRVTAPFGKTHMTMRRAPCEEVE